MPLPPCWQAKSGRTPTQAPRKKPQPRNSTGALPLSDETGNDRKRGRVCSLRVRSAPFARLDRAKRLVAEFASPFSPSASAHSTAFSVIVGSARRARTWGACARPGCHPEHATVQRTVALPSTRSGRREASRSDERRGPPEPKDPARCQPEAPGCRRAGSFGSLRSLRMTMCWLAQCQRWFNVEAVWDECAPFRRRGRLRPAAGSQAAGRRGVTLLRLLPRLHRRPGTCRRSRPRRRHPRSSAPP